jgi:hypothetical protein
LRKYFFFLVLISILSCKNAKDKATNDLSKSTVTINLPFESSNYDNATNFTLYDSSGKKCVAELDTVTKGGGTIIYKDLPNGTYNYLIKTIVGENIRKSVKVDSSIYIDFYANCYDVKNVIAFDSLAVAEKIDLLIETMTEADTTKTDAFKIEKRGNKYLFRHSLHVSGDWSNPIFVDSITLIKALAEFEMTVVGLREMEIKENDLEYTGTNSVYLKCDNQFLEIWNLKHSYLNSAFRKFKEAITKE